MSKARKEGGFCWEPSPAIIGCGQTDGGKGPVVVAHFIIESSNEEQPAGEDGQARNHTENKDAEMILVPKYPWNMLKPGL